MAVSEAMRGTRELVRTVHQSTSFPWARPSLIPQASLTFPCHPSLPKNNFSHLSLLPPGLTPNLTLPLLENIADLEKKG